MANLILGLRQLLNHTQSLVSGNCCTGGISANGGAPLLRGSQSTGAGAATEHMELSEKFPGGEGLPQDTLSCVLQWFHLPHVTET